MGSTHRVRVIVHSESGRVEYDFGPFDRFDQIVVGRSAEAGLFLDDRAIRRAHCKLYREGESLCVKLLDGQARVQVDGRNVVKAVRLRDRDVLQLGSLRVEISCGEATSSDARPSAAMHRYRDDTRPSTAENSDITTTPRPAAVGRDGDDSPEGRSETCASTSKVQGPLGAARPREESAGRTKSGPPPHVATGPQHAAGGEPVPRSTPNNFWARKRERSITKGLVEAWRPRSKKPLPSASEPFEIILEGEELILGRDATSDVALPNELSVSGRHAKLSRMAGTWTIEDLRSSRGTFLNGKRLARTVTLDPGDRISIGPYQFIYTGTTLTTHAESPASAIEVRGVAVPGRRKSLVLRDVSFAIEAGELVGLLGMSGSGKTRLMHAMCGRAPYVAGDIRYQGCPYAPDTEACRRSIGYVPSWLTLHESLTVASGLRYASQLRLSEDASESEVEGNIDRVLQLLRIGEHKNATMRILSDGQRRRVGLAVELLGSPPIMLLDEVTTALDLPTHCQFMKLFRELADSGKSLLLISHHLEDLELCDKWLYLVGGRVAFFGAPHEFHTYFGVRSLREQLELQATSGRSGAEWARRFTNTYGPPIFAPADESSKRSTHAPARHPRLAWGAIARQTKLLTSRYVDLLKSDRKNLGMMLGLAPAIAGILLLLHISLQRSVNNAKGLFESDHTPMTALISTAAIGKKEKLEAWIHAELFQSRILVFMLVMSSIIVGTFMSIREVVKENDIAKHERFAGAHHVAYLISKVGPLSILAIASTIGITLLLRLIGGSDAINIELWPLLALVSVTAVSAVFLGLLISAGVDASEKAFLILAPVLIVQLTMSGALIPLPQFLEPLAKACVLGFWAYGGLAERVPSFAADTTETNASIAAHVVHSNLSLQGTIPWVRATIWAAVHGLGYLFVTYFFLLRRDGSIRTSLRRELVTLGLLPERRKRLR